MTLAITSSMNVSLWQLAGIAVLYHAFNKNPLNDGVHAVAKNVIIDFPVTALAGGFTYLVHHFTTQKYPSISLATVEGTEGSLKVATFVIGIFALKSALSDYLQWVINCKKDKDNPWIVRGAMIHNCFPLALGAVAAYYTSVPIKLVQSALYTAGLIGLANLLGKGYEYVNKPEILGSIKNDLVASLLG